MKSRIQQRLAELNISARAASIKAGGSGDLIRGLLRGKQRSFRGENLEKLADALGVSVNWLLTGEDEHVMSEDIASMLGRNDERQQTGGTSASKTYTETIAGAIPEVDARAGAGNGSIGEYEVVATEQGQTFVGHKVLSEWVFPTAFIRHELRLQPGEIIVLEVIGDSMSPTLESGDRVIVDTTVEKAVPDGIYVIDEGDGPLVKRIQLVRRSDPVEIRILSDNKNHEPYTLRFDEIRLIGRVSGRVTKM